MSKILEDLLNNNQNSPNSSPTLANSSPDQEPNLMNILVSAIAPAIPIMLAKLTGQKLPAVNTVANEQNSLQQLTPLLQSMINTQNILLQEIAVLKKNDQNIANSFQGLKLTHERKQIEYNPQQNSNDHE